MNDETDIAQGAHNLLVNCAELKSHEALLIICEDPALGWYDAATAETIAALARKMGVTPTMLKVGAPENEVDAAVDAAIAAHDCTIYFARIGDQDRFGEPLPGKRSVMCYIRDIEMLASSYGRASYGAFVVLKEAVNDILLAAKHIEITCPLGTHYEGHASDNVRREKTDVSVRRFPLGVPLPMDAAQFSGQVALAHFLTPTGSKSYYPASIPLEDTTFVTVTDGRIVGFDGDEGQIGRIGQHYNMVADQFGIDRDIVHSWHAGIHPGSGYPKNAADDPDRWSNSVFTNPRFLHFHTCGDYAPAEICWMVLDPTICVDGVNLWDKGRLDLESFPAMKACVDQWPELADWFAHPAQDVGLVG